MRKIYIEIGEASNVIVKWIQSGEYKNILEACRGESKEDGFIGACMTLPAILLYKCTNYYDNNT